MAGRSAVLVLKILTDSTQAAAGLDKTASTADKWRKRSVLAATAVGAALVTFGKQAFDAASAAQQAFGAVDAVFGKSAGTVHAFGKTSAQTVGLATSDYETMAAVFGAQLKNMGVATDQLAPKTNNLVQLGADLAAQFGGSTSQATEALSALLRGERDPIERYGVSIKDANSTAYEAAHGLTGLTGAAKTNADMQATLALVTQQTASAHGRFAAESDTAAGQQQRSAAAAKDAAAALGKSLLPAVTVVSAQLAVMANFVQRNSTVVLILAGILGGLVVAVYAVNIALKAYATITQFVGIVQKATWLSNPIFLVIVAIVALVAVVVIAYKRFAWFRAAVAAVWAAIQTATQAVARVFMAVWNVAFAIVRAYLLIYKAIFLAQFYAIRAVIQIVATVLRVVFGVAFAVIRGYVNIYRAAAVAAFNAVRAAASAAAGLISGAFRGAVNALTRVFSGLGSILAGPFHALQSAISPVIGLINTIIDLISRIHIPHIPHIPGTSIGGNAVTGSPTLAAALAGTQATVPTRAAGRAGTAGGFGGVVINVTGALDPDAVARQIESILRRRQRRVGGVVAGNLT